MFCGTRRKREIAGIIGFSGQLVGKEVLKNEITSYPPILLINGDQDELIPVHEQKIAIKALKHENISVENDDFRFESIFSQDVPYAFRIIQGAEARTKKTPPDKKNPTRQKKLI